MRPTSWVALVVLLVIGSVVVYTSLPSGGVRCEVCMSFDGRSACRTVDGATEDDARAGARTNACALLTSGVTNTLACERSMPLRSSCSGR